MIKRSQTVLSQHGEFGYMKEILKTLNAAEFTTCTDIIQQENRLAIRHMVNACIPLCIANIVIQILYGRITDVTVQGYLLLVYFVVLAFIERYMLPKSTPHATALLYGIQLPAVLFTILMGTVWDPNHQALTFFLFLMSMPVLVLDRPIRVFSTYTLSTAVFLIMCMTVKTEETRWPDLYHTLEFYLASVVVTYVVLRIRLHSMQSQMRIRYHLEHDELTQIRNRNALQNQMQHYVGKAVLLLMVDLDQITLFNDFYGHEIGDEMMVALARLAGELFTKEHCYRLGGDEILCVLEGMDENTCLNSVSRLRQELADCRFAGSNVSVTCAVGYVTGKAKSKQEFADMVQLADIYAHQAARRGLGQTEGGVFDKLVLQEAKERSHLFSHARAYEINQLTGLPSLSYFLARTDELIPTVVDLSRKPAIGFFNVIHFKKFNDAFGYSQGDDLIKYTAKVLQQHFPSRHVCYITGSQFGILCYEDEIKPGMESVHRSLQRYKAGYPIDTKAGFALYSGREQAVSLMDKARVAHDSIYETRNTLYRVYDQRLDEENRFYQYLISHVDEAIERGYLQVYYQPIARAITGKVCNEEALSRWVDPVYGFLTPYRFIPTLEENRLIYKVNLHVVRQVLQDFDRKRAAGMNIVPVSVNLSRFDFEACDMVQEICKLVDASGYSRSMIKIEITESAFVKNQEMLKREVRRFREHGFEVWMDDFGSEYSTLNLLQELDFDLIKIDMQFMHHVTESGRNQIIVTEIIEMAKQLGITTLAEGVETVEQHRLLRKLGCEKIQGYLFNKPNDLDYIINRATTGTGLTFETGSEEGYYHKIDNIDLNNPFTSVDQAEHSSFARTWEMASGVLEYKGSTLSCIRSTEFFSTLMSDLGMGGAHSAGERRWSLENNPVLRNLVSQCRSDGRWYSEIVGQRERQSYTFYIRQIGVNQLNGATALLAILLPVHTD